MFRKMLYSRINRKKREIGAYLSHFGYSLLLLALIALLNGQPTFNVLASVPMNNSREKESSVLSSDAIGHVSDDFDQCSLDTGVWTFVNPLGDGTLSIEGGQAHLSVPQGTMHTVWGTKADDFYNTVPRLVQGVEDDDFELEVKFEASLSQRYQMEGILIQQDENDLLRIEFIHDGTSLEVRAVSLIEGLATIVHSVPITNGNPLYMRVTRVGDEWTQWYSYDGVGWTGMTSFTHTMTVSEVSVYVGNEIAANTVAVDYFYDTASPGDGDEAQFALILDSVGSGVVSKTPDKSTYVCGESVTLSATADPGWVFMNWSGDLSGSNNPINLSMDGNKSITANFEEGNAYTLALTIEGSGTVTVNPQQTFYSPDQVITLTATADPVWSFSGWSGDLTGSSNPETLTMTGDKTVTATFMPGGQSVESDDFDQCSLETAVWTFVNPEGDGELTVGGGQAKLSIPAGTIHSIWGTNAADFYNTVPRLVQSLDDEDFELEVKFDAPLSQGFQMEGLLIEQDENDMLRFEFIHDGMGLGVRAVSITAGTATIVHTIPIMNGSPLYMRVRRVGDQWTHGYSFNGIGWNVLGKFTHAMTVNSADIYIGNIEAANTVSVDYFYNTLAPGAGDIAAHTLTVDSIGNGVVSKAPDKAAYVCGETVVLTATPALDWAFTAWSGDLSGSVNPETLVVTGDKTVNATFLETTPPVAVDDDAITDEDSLVNIDVLDNDYDNEGDSLSVLDVSEPQHGSVEIQSDDTINYLPDKDYYGPDNFAYTIIDSHRGTDTAIVSVTVTPVNDAPVLSAIGNKSIDELSTLTFTAQASDIDGNDLTFSIDPGAPAGAAINPDSGFFAWTPSEAQGPGSYPVTVRVSDGLLSDFETLTISVAEVNSAPVAVVDHYETAMNTPLIVSADLGLLANDSDADGDAFYADLAENPDKGALTLNADGSFTYTPEVDFVGTVEFSYCAYDGQLYSEEIVVEIEVSDSGLVEPKPIFLPLLMKAP